MSLKDLRLMKKEDEVEAEAIEVDYLVVGNDLFSYYAYSVLIEDSNSFNVKILIERDEEISLKVFNGPSLIRGKENIEALKTLIAEEEISKFDMGSTYYKDQQFKKFNNRKRLNELLDGEDYWISKRHIVDYKKLFPFLNDCDSFETKLKNNLIKADVVSTEKIKQEDGEVRHKVVLSSGEIYETKNLIWGKSPKLFTDICKNKGDFASSFLEFCQKTSSNCALFVRFNFDKKVKDVSETFFLPLSYTHRWGHFIGEFDEENESGQSIELVNFLNEKDTNEEEIAKRIRILKKNLEKIFINIPFSKASEFITLKRECACSKIDDSLFFSNGNVDENITFVGYNAPVGILTMIRESFTYSLPDITHLPRGLFSIELLKEKLSK